MNHLPAPSTTVRLNALLAATLVALGLLSGITSLSAAQSAATQWAQAGAGVPG